MDIQEIKKLAENKNIKSFLITKKGNSVTLIPKNMDAIEIVTICNDISTLLCKEVEMSKFQILKLFLKSLNSHNRKINKIIGDKK